jgi:ATP-binding cassette subfamily C protein
MGMLDGAARLVYEDDDHGRREHETAQRRNEIIMLISKPIRAVAQVLVMGAAAWLVLEHGRSPAIIFATTLLFGRAIAPVEGAIAGWKAFAMTLASYRRLVGVLAAVAPVASAKSIPTQRLENRLIVNNVGVTLPGSGRALLKDVSFCVAPGECLGIIGPSGSGKSTLGRLIAGISVPTIGRVMLDNSDVSTLRDSGDRQRLGYLPQEIELFGDTIGEIIGRLGVADPQKVIDAAKLAGIHDTIMRLPRAYDTALSEANPMRLRGFRQRLGLARALFGEPRLVVLDEPNASLDYLGERVLYEAIERVKATDAIVIIITHRMGVLAATDKIAIVQAGALNAFGDSKEIFDRYLTRPQSRIARAWVDGHSARE